MATVLVVEGDARQALALAAALAAAGHVSKSSDTPESAVSLLDNELVDLVVIAEEVADAVLERVLVRWPDLPVLLTVDAEHATRAESALRQGAADFLTRPFVAEEVVFVVGKVLAAAAKRAEHPTRGTPTETTLLGESAGMQKLRDLMRRTAAGSATALIRGETGTGKELVARAVHAGSARRDKPFVKIDCASLPDTLLESELFGYEKGAFTGATSRKPGRIELAEGGTLFLDEIGEVSAVVQAKLLRLLQDRVFERLGGRAVQRIDVRFVLATHRDLETMVQNGSFRQDLFHRLNVVPLWIPPLRARREDIEVLARAFVQRFGTACGKPSIELTPAALRVLRSQRWPGNVRQLENFVERLVVLSDTPRIDVGDVERELVQKPEFLTQQTETVHTLADGAPESGRSPLVEAVQRAERAALVTALKRADGNRTLAARVLGVSRATLYNKLKELGIEQR